MSFEVHGHRGARAIYPENTLEGFRYSLSVGADAIEIDVALTSDKVPVIIHDRSLNNILYRRFSSNGLLQFDESPWIKDLSLDKLSSIDVGSVKHPDFPKQKILLEARMPTLDAFVELMMSAAKKPILNIEIKTHPIVREESLPPEDFAEKILAVLTQHQVPYERVLFQSFDPGALLAIKCLDSAWKCSFLVDTWTDDLPEVAHELRIEALSPRHDLLDPERAKLLKQAGLDIYVWTPNSEVEWGRLSQLGVDGIITDDPEACLAFRARYRS